MPDTSGFSSNIDASAEGAKGRWWLPGDRIGRRWFVHRSLPPSHMGVVYFCFDTASGIPVVAKSLPPEKLVDPAIRTRFLEECNLWVLVGKHSTIVEALYVESVDSIPYIFIEWIVGQVNCFDASAAHLIRRHGALPIELALSLATDVCDGMIFLADSFASKGLNFVHSDLKPSNVLVDGRWAAKVTDFGLSSALQSMSTSPSDLLGKISTSATTGLVAAAGTVAYMAPERFHAEKQLDVRSDVYSFGCTLWELVTGRRLFDCADKQQWIDAHLNRNPDFATLHSCGLSGGFLELLKACLEKSSSNRPRNFSEVMSMLSQIGGPLSRKRASHSRSSQPMKGIPDDLQQAITDASSLDAMGKCREALEIFNGVRHELNRNPDHPPIVRFSLGWNRAIALEHLGEHDEALNEWDALLSLLNHEDLTKGRCTHSAEPSRPNVLIQKAKTLSEIGRVDEAISLCMSALDLSPHVPESASTLASLHLKAGHSEESEHWAKRAIESNAYDATALATMGNVLASKGSYDEGLSYMERALAVSPSHAYALYSKGTCLLRIGHYEKAVEALQRAVEFQPHYSEAWNHLGLAKRELGDADCRNCFATAVKENPNNHAARANLGINDAHVFMNTLLQLLARRGGVFQIPAGILTGEFLDAFRQRIAQFEQVRGRKIGALEEAARSLDKIRHIVGVQMIECIVEVAAEELSIHFRYALGRNETE